MAVSKCAITIGKGHPDSTQPPYQCPRDGIPECRGRRTADLIPEVLARSHAHKRLQRREICRGEKRV